MKLLSSKGSLVATRSSAGKQLSRMGDHPYATAAAVGVAALAISALANRRAAKTAERLNPPQGQFLEIDGVRLHYVERGKGEPLVLLHGNGSMIQDFESSGLLDKAAKTYRVIVFDRPGYGHSRRPRGTLWSPEAQADLIHEALVELDATPAIVLGHSWGASVAVALALKHKASVKALILASGYYYPTARLDVAAASGPAIPILGDILRYTLAPILGRIMWPLMMRKIFGPAEVPQKFTDGFPHGLALRPSQIRASAAEIGFDDPGRFWAAREVRGPDHACRHHRWRARPPDRPRPAVGPAPSRHWTQHLPFGGRGGAHGSPDGHGQSDGRNRRSGRGDARKAQGAGGFPGSVITFRGGRPKVPPTNIAPLGPVPCPTRNPHPCQR